MVATNGSIKKPTAPASPPRMTLGAVTSGRRQLPTRALVYGTEGVGKSTFAADAPSPIFLGAEEGTAHLDVDRFPAPSTWSDFHDAVKALENDEHAYRTLVIDTLDWAEPYCWESVCRDAGKKNIEDLGYGRGYVAAVDKWRELLVRLDALRHRRGMHVVLLAHSTIRTFKNPEGEDFDRYELKLHQKSAGLIKEWADAVLFANYETFAHAKEGRVRGISTGARLLFTERRAAFDAKNRYSLPEQMPLSWSEFEAAVSAHQTASPARLRSQVEALLPQLAEGDAKKATAALERAGSDAEKLAQLVNWARGKVNLTKEESEQ